MQACDQSFLYGRLCYFVLIGQFVSNHATARETAFESLLHDIREHAALEGGFLLSQVPGASARETTNAIASSGTAHSSHIAAILSTKAIMAAEPKVTPYQSRVYTLLKQIPKGKVSTYAEMSKALGSSPRAVGGALRCNPFAPEVPCHRIIQADGVSLSYHRLADYCN